jgi:hypothetical protein
VLILGRKDRWPTQETAEGMTPNGSLYILIRDSFPFIKIPEYTWKQGLFDTVEASWVQDAFPVGPSTYD